MRGLFLSIYYIPEDEKAIGSVYYIIRTIRGGWIMRNVHARGANVMFVCLYAHIARGVYYGSYLNKRIWYRGLGLMFATMLVSFLGYILP